MPIYEFVCKKCKEVFESFVMKGADDISCPKCGSKELEKLISTPNVCCPSDSGSHSSCGGSNSGFS